MPLGFRPGQPASLPWKGPSAASLDHAHCGFLEKQLVALRFQPCRLVPSRRKTPRGGLGDSR